MKLFGRKKAEAMLPDWHLSITPGIVVAEERIIDGVRVSVDKTGWTWNVIREDLRGKGASWWWDSGFANTKDEALEIGLKKMKKAQAEV